MAKIKLANVRCAYPTLFEPRENTMSGKMEYSIKIILQKDDKQIEMLKKVMADAFVAKFGPEKGPKKLRTALESKNTRFLQWDDDNEYFYINLKRKSADGAPVVIDRHKKHLSQADGLPYSGCYVNVSLDGYVYDKQSTGFGASLNGVQFVADGEPFGGASRPSEDDFDDLGDDGSQGEEKAPWDVNDFV